jgi:hypothetical protein
MVRCCLATVAAPADRAFHLGRLDRYRCSRVFVLAGRPHRCGRRARELQASLDSAAGAGVYTNGSDGPDRSTPITFILLSDSTYSIRIG